MSEKKAIASSLAFLGIFLIGSIAILSAWKLRTRTALAPTAPQSKPLAALNQKPPTAAWEVGTAGIVISNGKYIWVYNQDTQQWGNSGAPSDISVGWNYLKADPTGKYLWDSGPTCGYRTHDPVTNDSKLILFRSKYFWVFNETTNQWENSFEPYDSETVWADLQPASDGTLPWSNDGPTSAWTNADPAGTYIVDTICNGKWCWGWEQITKQWQDSKSPTDREAQWGDGPKAAPDGTKPTSNGGPTTGWFSKDYKEHICNGKYCWVWDKNTNVWENSGDPIDLSVIWLSQVQPAADGTLPWGMTRPDICLRTDISSNSLPEGGQVTITAYAKSDYSPDIVKIQYSVYNKDNEYTPGNPKPVCVEGDGNPSYPGDPCYEINHSYHHLIFLDVIDPPALFGSHTFNYNDLHVKDYNAGWDQSYLEHASINVYFIDENGGFSQADSDCVEEIGIGVCDSNIKVKFSIKFPGIISQLPDQPVSLKIADKNDPVGTYKEEFNNLNLTSDSSGVYQTPNWLCLSQTPACQNCYSFLIQGPKHLQTRYCFADGQTRPCDRQEAQITVNSGENQYDFSGYPIPAGDLPPQDNAANAFDAVALTNCFQDPKGADCLAKADINLDGIVNTMDMEFLNQTIYTKWGDE